MKKIATLIILLLITIIYGCASMRGTGAATTYTQSIGNATEFDVKQKTHRVLVERYSFDIVRFTESSDLIYFETDWRERLPLDDEIALGVEATRSRIIIEARPRTRTYFTVRFNAETMGRFTGSDTWEYIKVTNDLRAYMRDIARDLERELDSGIRLY